MSESLNKQQILVAFLEQLGKIPAILLSTKEGVGLTSIMIGTMLKAAGVGQPYLQIKPEFKGSQEWVNDVFGPTGLDEKGFCAKYPKSAAGADYCELNDGGLVVDAFPFELTIAGVKVIPAEFGRVPVPDLLIGGGFLTMSAEFWKGVIEGVGAIVPG